MNGCIYKTKDNECELWSDNKHKSFCDEDCKDKHPSNSDFIRSLEDEEMAIVFASAATAVCDSSIREYLMEDMKKGYLVWLKQEYGK